MRRVSLPLVAVFAVAAGLVFAWHAAPPEAPAETLAGLRPGHRLLEGRSALALPWAPHDPAAPLAPPGEVERSYARLLSMRAARTPGAAEGLQLLYLARGEPGDVDRAFLLHADLGDGADAENERGLALLAVGRAEESLDRFAAALRQRPNHRPALFNRAIALGALGLSHVAADAWDLYLAHDRDSPWAAEARERRRALVSRTLAPRPEEALKDELLHRIIAARGPADLAPLRDGIARLAAAGDGLYAAALARLDALPPGGWASYAAEAEALERLTTEVKAGRNVLDSPLHRSDHPLVAIRALQWSAYGAILSGERARATLLLHRILERCRPLGCGEEPAMATSDLGTVLLWDAHYAAAERAFDEGLAGMPEGFDHRRAELLHKRADLANRLGDVPEAIRLGRLAAAAQEKAGRRADVYDFLASIEGELGHPAARLAYLQEALLLAPSDDVWLRAKLHRNVLQVHRDEGRLPEALEEARRLLEFLDGTDFSGLACSIRSHLAELLAETGDREGALAEIDRAEPDLSFPSRGAGSVAAERLARAALRLGDEARALALAERAHDLELQALDDASPLAAQRRRAEASSRTVLHARLEARRGAAAAAASELGGGPLPPLLDGECRLAIGIDRDGILAIAVTREGAHVDESPRPANLAAALDAYDRRGPTAETLGALAAALGSAWGPGRCPVGATRVAILDTPATVGAPLSAVARYQHPEALVALATRADAPWPGAIPRDSALAVLDPTLAPDEPFPAPPLPAAAREVESIARTVQRVRRVSGPAATPATVHALAGGFDVLHFAVHGVSRAGLGAASCLLLAGPGGRLEVADVLELGLRERAPLVVLPACRTAGAPRTSAEDGAGLPWAFLEAGATAVIATARAIEDDAAAEFSAALYRALAEGHAVPEAMAEATVALSARWPREVGASFALYFGPAAGARR